MANVRFYRLHSYLVAMDPWFLTIHDLSLWDTFFRLDAIDHNILVHLYAYKSKAVREGS